MNVITHTFVGLKCLTETKIQILCDHVSHTRLHTVEMGCQMVQLMSAHIVGPTMCVNLTLALRRISCHGRNYSQPYFFKRNQSSDNRSHGFGAKFLLKKLSASDFSYERKSAFRLRSNWQTLLVQHDVTVDHTMLSGVVKRSNLQCSTMCDNVC